MKPSEFFDVTKDLTAPDGFPNHHAPTYWNQLFHARQLRREKGWHAVREHARVSIDNRHRCRSCFCCACLEVMMEPARDYEKRR